MRIASPSLAWLSSLLCLVSPSMLHAGGILLYEYASDNVSLANAGAAARAQGPSTLASNPAGLVFLPGTQVSGGLQLVQGHLSVDTDVGSIPGDDSGNIVEWMPGGSFFVSHEVNQALSVGFGLYGDFGLAGDYDEEWSGRYFVQDASIVGVSLAPSLAYRLTEQWSIGLGLRAVYGVLENHVAVDNNPLGIGNFADGQLHYKGDDWGYGANLGVIYQPREGTRIGLSYTTAVDLEFEDRLSIDNLRPALASLLEARGILGAPLRIDMSIPQTATLSLYQALDAQWALLASAGWQDWSEFGRVGIELDSDNPTSAMVDRQYRDTWHLAVGGQYQATPALLWQAGLAYDSSAVSDSERTFDTPMAESWRLATGVSYAFDRGAELNLSYAFIWMGDMPVSQSKGLNGRISTSGEFADAGIHVLSSSITWRY